VHSSVQSFSCKINCTEVKYVATKLHTSSDKTDRARSRSLLQKRDSDFGYFLISCDIRECLSQLNDEFSLGPNLLYTFEFDEDAAVLFGRLDSERQRRITEAVISSQWHVR